MTDWFQQKLLPNGYFRQEELTYADCDCNERARVGALMSKAAVFAGYDYDARGLTHQVLYDRREVFLLSRMALHIHDCPRTGDVLNITTWENGARGAHMQRVYEMADQDGRVRVSVKSEWILVDPQTRKIMRPNAFTAKKLELCEKEIDCPQPQKILLPKEGLEERGTRRVVWTDLDGNGHLYSGKYGDIVWDYLPADLQRETPREFFINYSKEATLGEDLRIVGIREDRCYRMEGLGLEGTCFTAVCVF